MTLKPFVCKYCNHSYSRESTLQVHVCEQKRRALAQHDKNVVIAFDAFKRFFELTQHSTKPKTYEDFARSPYYNAFVSFGSFVSNVKPLYPFKFIDYVIKSNTKLDQWASDSLYDKYVVDLIKSENVETALERSLNHMVDWAEANNAQWNHYFKYVSLSRAVFDIKDGKISPWIILNSITGREMVKRFSDDQLEMVSAVMDIPYWLRKFKTQVSDTELAKQIAKESKL